MQDVYSKFVADAKNKAFDPEHRRKIRFNISRYDKAVTRGKTIYADLEKARERAANLKHRVISDLDKYLIEFESNFTARGGKVIWAQDADEAMAEVVKVLEKHAVKLVVKSKSMTTEEVEVNQYLEKHKMESVETDLGEYIVQVAGQKPYHIVTPAMHMSKEDIADLFHEQFDTPKESTPTELTNFVREKLRQKFVTAGAGITGANFLVADTGAIAMTENEGNGMMSMAFPKVHIAIAGIEKIVASASDLDLFWPLLATHGTGQNMTVYNSLVTGPKKGQEKDGPEEMYVVLLDNGRSELLARERQRRALSCIRCGACLNACPVYKSIGGHAYGTTYSGPIGSVISPHYNGMKEYKHLSFASSLCGNCTEVCPVKINLHELLLDNRHDSVEQGYFSFFDKFSMFGWKKIMLNRWMMDIGGSKMKNLVLKIFFRKLWGPRRALPQVQPKNFKQMWNEKYGHKK